MTQSPQSAKVDGRNATITAFSNSSPFQGQTETDVLVTVDRPDGLFYILFIAPQGDFKNAEGPFQNMVKSIHIN